MTAGSDAALRPKPQNLSFAEAASVPVAALTALQALRDHGQLQPGQRVLVNGASGGVGTFAVQIAKALKAEVTGLCKTRNVVLVTSLGADHVIDYTATDFTASKERYDLLVDIAGSRPVSASRKLHTRNGATIGVGVRPAVPPGEDGAAEAVHQSADAVLHRPAKRR